MTAPPVKRHPYNQWTPDSRALDIVGDKWTLLIIRDLVSGPRRFVALQRVLPGISTEQLRSRLNRMVADGLLTRERYREVPPRVDYELTDRARDLLPVIGALAQWGARWAWSPPQNGEEIDIGAILRSLPGIPLPPGLDGSLDLVISAPDGPVSRYAVSVSGGRAAIAERVLESADAGIAGTEMAWVDAFSPRPGDPDLQFTGDVGLAREFLSAATPAVMLTDDLA